MLSPNMVKKSIVDKGVCDEEHMQNIIKLEKLKGRMRYREMYAALSPNLGKII